jgi:dipeptidase D
MKDTVETSNNVGRIVTEEDNILVTTHTHSSVDSEMESLSQDIANVFEANGATSKVVMPAPAWQEGPHSQFINDIGLVLQKLLSRLCS